LNETSLPANFWEGQHSVLSEIFDLKKEYEDLLSAHTNVRADLKSLVEEKNNLLAQLSNKEYECSTLSADVKSCQLKISRLEFELKSRTSESLNGRDSSAVSSGAVYSSPPKFEAFIPISRSAIDRPAATAASVSPYVSTSRSPYLSASRAARTSGVLPTSPVPLFKAAENSRDAPAQDSSFRSYSPSQIGEVVEDLPGSDHVSLSYSQKMKQVLDLVSTLDSRLLSLDEM
jgi:hypothetical protein